MNILTTYLLLAAMTANLLLLLLVLRRTAKPATDPLEPVRTELRLARDESRASCKELREEVANRVQSMDDALSKMLADHGQSQQTHQAGMAAQMRELAEAARTRDYRLANSRFKKNNARETRALNLSAFK